MIIDTRKLEAIQAELGVAPRGVQALVAGAASAVIEVIEDAGYELARGDDTHRAVAAVVAHALKANGYSLRQEVPHVARR